jgi:hypothetical protein
VIGGIVVGFGGYLLYNTVNKAGANSSRVVREPLLAEAMAARRRDTFHYQKGYTLALAYILFKRFQKGVRGSKQGTRGPIT